MGSVFAPKSSFFPSDQVSLEDRRILIEPPTYLALLHPNSELSSNTSGSISHAFLPVFYLSKDNMATV